jgi:hypothetical protein
MGKGGTEKYLKCSPAIRAVRKRENWSLTFASRFRTEELR